MSRSLGRTAQIGPLFSKIGPKLFAGDGAVSSSFDRRAMLGWNIPARHPRPNCLMANSDQIGKRLLRPGDLDCSGDVVMEAHNQHSTTVECKGQQLCIGNLQMRSSLPPMNMGKRLKQELADRGMDPIALCEYVDVEVQSIRRVGSKVEVEVTDNETGEDRTLEMDAD